jgi:putative nucleotidyltransferase with HDIG domain
MTKDEMRDKLLDLIPELTHFHSDELRDMVIATWIDACQKAGRDPGELVEMPFTLLVGECKVSFIQHTRAVTQTAMAIGDALRQAYPGEPRMHADHDTLLAGAILHDVGKVLEIGRDAAGKWVKTESGKLLRHPISGANLAFAHGLPERVLHCIACHSKEGDGYRSTVEAIIINHADFVNFEPLH